MAFLLSGSVNNQRILAKLLLNQNMVVKLIFRIGFVLLFRLIWVHLWSFKVFMAEFGALNLLKALLGSISNFIPELSKTHLLATID